MVEKTDTVLDSSKIESPSNKNESTATDSPKNGKF